MAVMQPAGRHGILAVPLVACLFLMGLNALTRVREFTPDSMSYVDVARNFVAGHGLSQSALGFGRATFTPDDPIPAPFTAHAPGFSLLIALTSRAGVSVEDTALVLAALFCGLSIVVAFLLARECYGVLVAWFVAALLVNYYPLRHAAAVAWSETAAVFMAMCALWLLARYRRRSGGGGLSFLVGLFSGFAFAIRYPLSELAVVTGAGVITARADRRLRDGIAFAFGALCSVGPVLARNVALTHTLTGAASNPHATPLLTNLAATVWSLAEIYQPHYLESPPARLELWGLAAALVITCVGLAVQRRLPAAVRECALDASGPLWITIWAVAYLAFINAVRSVTWFDDLTHRLTLPAGVALVIVVAAFAGSAVRKNSAVIITVSVLLLASALTREVRFLATHAPASRNIPWTPRLTWVANRTTSRDLIIGDYTMDLPFYFVGRRTITFEHYPYTNKPTYEGLNAYIHRHCREYDHAYLIVRNWYGTNLTLWVESFGWMISDLMLGGDNPKYREYHLLSRLDDSAVFRVEMPGCAPPADR